MILYCKVKLEYMPTRSAQNQSQNGYEYTKRFTGTVDMCVPVVMYQQDMLGE